jgi:hypothetical protein
VFLAACGSDGGKVYTLNSGTYSLGSVSAVQPDNCNLAAIFADGNLIGLDVANNAATLRLGNEAANPARNPVSSINSNTMELSSTKTYDSPFNASCTETISITVSGEILADDQFSGTLKYQSQAAAGSAGIGCTSDLLQYKALPCASTLTFIAKKQ